MSIDTFLPKKFAVEVVRKLNDAGHRALWAGGCVRDLVLGHEPKDYDVATTATPDEVRALFGRKHTVPVGASFGVILVVGTHRASQIEVATFRREGEYIDGRRPLSVEFCTPEEDAHRRDFTINGMFFDPLTETIYDYVGGEQDLRNRLLRCIGNPADRFAEDKLRMLRAVRFTARFGFQLEQQTASAVKQHAAEIAVVSVERIAQELLRMLSDDHRRQAVELAIELGLWNVILPELAPLEDDNESSRLTLRILQHLETSSPELGLAVLCREKKPGDAWKLASRLKLSNQQRDQIAWLVEHQNNLSRPESLPLHRLKTLLVHPYASDLLEWSRAEQLVRMNSVVNFEYCDHYLQQTPRERLDPEPILSGDDLIRFGMKPGKRFKELLNTVRLAQLDEQIATKAEALELVARLQAESGPDKT